MCLAVHASPQPALGKWALLSTCRRVVNDWEAELVIPLNAACRGRNTRRYDGADEERNPAEEQIQLDTVTQCLPSVAEVLALSDIDASSRVAVRQSRNGSRSLVLSQPLAGVRGLML